MPKNNMKLKKKNRSNNNNTNNVPRILRPLSTTIHCTKKFRFYARAAATKLDLKDQDILFLLGVAVSPTSLSPIFGSVRLREIEMIYCNATPSSDGYIAVEFKGNNPSFGNNSVIKSANSLSTFQYAHLKTRPPPDSYAAAWVYPSTYNLCQITAPQGTIIDVTLEFTLLDDTPSWIDPSVTSGLTTGEMYSHSLCWTNGPGAFLPQGWNYNNV